ncbi:NAD(P)/FAD-dependent oxidoreductase [Pseudonocardia eucalypti]|uniref:NAD(P)/FAD-dependent oxidoreductase n=1 Tax=Pseudonocardia eucalypti TaxID=648755 RepID=A0ABP9QGY7_9PSEU|nr:cyclohexanone monooxygenase [Pseudonocardia eucalypti]
MTAHGNGTRPDFDAVVIGMGFGGLRMLWELHQLGLSVRAYERGSDVGGTWYWNRYPGARTDSEAWVYCMFFDEKLKQEWDWPERFPKQPDMERYLQHVADRFDMRRDIRFETVVTSAVYQEGTGLWEVGTDRGETVTCRYLISATGLLHVAYEPPFPGLESFEGESYLTSRWPKEPVDFAGKRVAVVGTGATAVQVIPEVAREAEHLRVFQRTPNYVLPSRNHALEKAQRDEIKRDYPEIIEKLRKQPFAFPMDPANRMYDENRSPEEVRRILDAAWEAGGFYYLFTAFDDLLIDERSNRFASDFLREKIRTIVRDPETAEKLTPKYPYAGKRPPLGHFYYETFNRDNVDLVDVKADPIAEITPTGIRLESGEEHEADIIIFALGFDALTGALTEMDLRGRGGVSMRDKWADGVHTYLGLCVDSFPNFFMLSGPQSPFANIPAVLDQSVAFVGRLLGYLGEHGVDRIEPTGDAVHGWGEKCQALLDMAPPIKAGLAVSSWFLGANIPGKKPSVLFYFGGAAAYFDDLEKVADRDFDGFAMVSPAGV